MDEPKSGRYIEATIADVERKKEALAAQLREADDTLKFLRSMLPAGNSETERPTNRFERRRKTKVSKRVKPKKATQVEQGKQMSVAAFAVKIITEAKSFLHRSEIEQAFAAAGFAAKSNSLSSVLSQLGKDAHKLDRFRFDHTMNTVHWGLPEWVEEDAFGKHVIPQYAPKGPIAQGFRLEDAKFDF